MARRLRAVLLAAAVVCPLSACSTDDVYWWGNHFKAYGQVIRRDAIDIYRSFDRNFMNYDWDDPYID